MNDDLSRRLQSLGLSGLEAEVYLALLEQGDVTAYRVGKRLGRATANVYSAMESLAGRGAVQIEDGEPRLCRATPPEVFLAQLESRFARSCASLRRDLEAVRTRPDAEQVVQVRSAAAALEAARSMIERAEQIVVFDGFPRVTEELKVVLTEAAIRGVDVYCQVYGDSDWPRSKSLHVVRARQSEQIVEFWRGEQLNLVVDGRRALLAFLDPELARVHQAIQTDLVYVVCMLHAGFLREHTHHVVAGALEGGNLRPADRRRLLADDLYFHRSDVPGMRELQRRFAESGEAGGPK